MTGPGKGRRWTRHRWLMLAFAVALVLALGLGARAVMFTLHWSDPANRDPAIAGWMTPRYVMHGWHVPPDVVGEALGLDRDGMGRRMTLAEIATAQGITEAELTARLTTAIAAFRAAQ